jgi:hypothetical protein
MGWAGVLEEVKAPHTFKDEPTPSTAADVIPILAVDFLSAAI